MKFFSRKTRPVWTGYNIPVRHKLITHYKTRLYTAYKKGNGKYYCFSINKDGKMNGWVQKRF